MNLRYLILIRFRESVKLDVFVSLVIYEMQNGIVCQWELFLMTVNVVRVRIIVAALVAEKIFTVFHQCLVAVCFTSINVTVCVVMEIDIIY